ncbi:hypothetical protein MJD09_20505 [bacterium]|nr:hypothetical protein [bacterium]
MNVKGFMLIKDQKNDFISSYLALLLRFALGTIFILSALGKILDLSQSTQTFSQLFDLPQSIATILVISGSILEAVLAALVLLNRIWRFLLIIPVIFSAVQIFSYWYRLNCGCFGSLPFISQLSLSSHLMLLAGMLLGFYYLIGLSHTKKTFRYKQGIDSKVAGSHLVGLASILLFAFSFASLPFSASEITSSPPGEILTIDKKDVEFATSRANATLVDARPAFQFEFGHIPGALNLPHDAENLGLLIQRHALETKPLIVYCSSSHCKAAEILAAKLLSNGCENISIYRGGWEDWQKHHAKQLAESSGQ